MPLVQLQLVADRQPRTLTLFFEAAQLGQPAIKVVDGGANSLFVAAGAGAGQLTQSRLGAAEAISVQLLRLLRNQPILASCELIEPLDVDAAAQGSSDFGHREAGRIPLLARSSDCWSRNDRWSDRWVGGRRAAAALRWHYAASSPRRIDA